LPVPKCLASHKRIEVTHHLGGTVYGDENKFAGKGGKRMKAQYRET